MKIILIEPDRQLSSITRDYLENSGYEVNSHADLQQAVQAADKQKPSAIVSELQLAGRSGIELLYEFRSYPDWQDVPLIIHTGLRRQELEPYLPVLSAQNITLLHKAQAGLADLAQELRRQLQPSAA